MEREFRPIDPDEYRRREGIDIDQDQYETVDESLKDIENKMADGRTLEFEEQRKAGKLPSYQETLAEVAARANQPEKKALTQEMHDLVGELRKIHDETLLMLQHQPPSPERDERMVVAANAGQAVDETLTSYELGLGTEEVVVRRLNELRSRMLEARGEVH